jgi:ferredoxin
MSTSPALEIDWTRCDGHGLCAELLPALITRDDWGFPIFTTQVTTSERDLRRAITVCPALALRLST